MSSRKVRFGVAGCGVVATGYYLPYLMNHPGAELVAVCDLEPKRTAACVRLYGAEKGYQDYSRMIQEAGIDAVLILTGPAPHAAMAIEAARAGKHVLIQKPMATTLDDAREMVSEIRKAGVKAVVEPGSCTPLEGVYHPVRKLIDGGVLGQITWFSALGFGPADYHWRLKMGGNPYGFSAFWSRDSAGPVFDTAPYTLSLLVTLLGPARSVTAAGKTQVPERRIVGESRYTEWLEAAESPRGLNYWDVVTTAETTQDIRMEVEDNLFALYEMQNGALGCYHFNWVTFHPTLPALASDSRNLKIYGTDGNLVLGSGHFASFISRRRDLLPGVGEDGWYHMPDPYGPPPASSSLPKPRGFNYYEESTAHLIDCILTDAEPVPGPEWGLHITEMMWGAVTSARTGRRYEMTTTL